MRSAFLVLITLDVSDQHRVFAPWDKADLSAKGWMRLRSAIDGQQLSSDLRPRRSLQSDALSIRRCAAGYRSSRWWATTRGGMGSIRSNCAVLAKTAPDSAICSRPDTIRWSLHWA